MPTAWRQTWRAAPSHGTVCARLPVAHGCCNGNGAPQGCTQAGRRGCDKDTAGAVILSSDWGQGCAGGMELVAGRRELVDKGFLSGSNLYEKPVGPVGLGMLCARCRHCLVFYRVRE